MTALRFQTGSPKDSQTNTLQNLSIHKPFLKFVLKTERGLGRQKNDCPELSDKVTSGQLNSVISKRTFQNLSYMSPFSSQSTKLKVLCRTMIKSNDSPEISDRVTSGRSNCLKHFKTSLYKPFLKSLHKPVSQFGLAVRLVSRRMLVWYRFSSPFSSKRLWFVNAVLWLCPSLPTETLKWLSSLPILMQVSFWWWQCSDRYIISLFPHLHNPSLISLMVSVDVNHNVYFVHKTERGLGRKTIESNDGPKISDTGRENIRHPWPPFRAGKGKCSGESAGRFQMGGGHQTSLLGR